jgi:hypothetical protein
MVCVVSVFFCSFLPLPLLRYQLRSLGQLAWVSFVCFLYMWMRHMGIFHSFCLTLLSPQELQGLGVLRKGIFCLFLLSVYWSWGSRATPRFPVQGFFCLEFLLYMWFVESVHPPTYLFCLSFGIFISVLFCYISGLDVGACFEMMCLAAHLFFIPCWSICPGLGLDKAEATEEEGLDYASTTPASSVLMVIFASARTGLALWCSHRTAARPCGQRKCLPLAVGNAMPL